MMSNYLDGQLDGGDIRVIRVMARLKQRELAALVGVPRQRVSEWELGLRRPTREQRVKLMFVLDAAAPPGCWTKGFK